MNSTDSKPLPAIGFLTVVRYEQHGFLGGYLVLNTSGRPLEFHCTAPVKPNRAQEILYGPTLEPYLYGDQIGQALVAKSQLAPLAICTDLAAVLSVREFTTAPVALVVASDDEPAPPTGPSQSTAWHRIDAGHQAVARPTFQLGANRLAVAPTHTVDQQRIAIALEHVAGHFDLSEPFERIRGAIDEAQRSGR